MGIRLVSPPRVPTFAGVHPYRGGVAKGNEIRKELPFCRCSGGRVSNTQWDTWQKIHEAQVGRAAPSMPTTSKAAILS